LLARPELLEDIPAPWGVPLRLPGVPPELLRGELLRWLTGELGAAPFGGAAAFAGTPLAISGRLLPELRRLTEILERAFKAIVLNYSRDERIRRIYDLDPELEDILALADGVPYAIGAFRPDVLQAADGGLKLCEIGARFPLNGWMISHYLDRAIARCGIWSGGAPARLVEDVPDAIQARFDPARPLAVLMQAEKGSEIHWLLDAFRARGMRVQCGVPGSLAATDRGCTLNGDPVSQFILELDRTELRHLHPGALRHMIRTGACLNDVRTLILVHDKRGLAVLYDASIMNDYLPAGDHAFLRPYLIPSFSLHDAARRSAIAAQKDGWVLKRSSGGRGEGMYMGHECTPGQWRQLCGTQWRDYMAQAFVDQKPHRLDGTAEAIHFVGMLLCLDGRLCGPGIFRGSANAVINVHQGRGSIYPAILCGEPR
jgi:hypothetical protein